MRASTRRFMAAIATLCLVGCLCGVRTAVAICVGGAPNGTIQEGEQCDDGNLEEADCCYTNCISPCDDRRPCTQDKCMIRTDGKLECNHPWYPNGEESVGCADGDLCTIDVCHDRSCVHQPLSCDDHNVCTAETCDPGSGCHYVATNEGDPCNDGNDCTFQTRCLGGVCGGGLCDVGMPCAVGPCQASCQLSPSGY